MESVKNRKGAAIKAALLIIFIVAAIVVVRFTLVYFPFTPMNFGMGLTKVRFWDYFSGTALGIVVGTFILTFFFGTVKEIWAGGNWVDLISWKVMFSLALFVSSFFIPQIIKRVKTPGRVETA
ncbi:MAG: hypothetical protein HY895_04950 [Deltaproteobacteria bacterium]|nr:hypothetical protein [Deltaproteobacteria bacterium]